MADKRYMDNKRPVIAMWATAKMTLQADGTGWHMSVNAIGDKQAGYKIMISGRIFYGSWEFFFHRRRRLGCDSNPGLFG